MAVEDVETTVRLEELFGYQLRRASTVAMADISTTLAGFGLRPTLYGILSTIEQNPGLSQSDVGRRLAIQRANMVPLLAELERAGWIDRDPDPNDRRGRLLTIAPARRDDLARVHRAVLDQDLALMKKVGRDLERLRTALARIWQE